MIKKITLIGFVFLLLLFAFYFIMLLGGKFVDKEPATASMISKDTIEVVVDESNLNADAPVAPVFKPDIHSADENVSFLNEDNLRMEMDSLDAGLGTDGHDEFDPTPYMTIEQIEEVLSFTSRDVNKVDFYQDEDGNDAADLNYQWSHAMVVVVDEDGNVRQVELDGISDSIIDSLK